VGPDGLVHTYRRFDVTHDFKEDYTNCDQHVYDTILGLSFGWSVKAIRPPMVVNCMACLCHAR